VINLNEANRQERQHQYREEDDREFSPQIHC
jgi:hypothetical protein